MNWEVWTMPRKTSCCNGTLLRSDVRHYWPAGFLYVLVWLMIRRLDVESIFVKTGVFSMCWCG